MNKPRGVFDITKITKFLYTSSKHFVLFCYWATSSNIWRLFLTLHLEFISGGACGTI